MASLSSCISSKTELKNTKKKKKERKKKWRVNMVFAIVTI